MMGTAPSGPMNDTSPYCCVVASDAVHVLWPHCPSLQNYRHHHYHYWSEDDLTSSLSLPSTSLRAVAKLSPPPPALIKLSNSEGNPIKTWSPNLRRLNFLFFHVKMSDAATTPIQWGRCPRTIDGMARAIILDSGPNRAHLGTNQARLGPRDFLEVIDIDWFFILDKVTA